jgi:hypothetical protein
LCGLIAVMAEFMVRRGGIVWPHRRLLTKAINATIESSTFTPSRLSLDVFRLTCTLRYFSSLQSAGDPDCDVAGDRHDKHAL